jgi:hypothetical protein
MADQKSNEEQNQKVNEFVMTRSKGFSYLAYLNIVSKISFGDNEATIETDKKWLYFIKGKQKTVSFDYKSIANVEVKTVFAFWDLLFSILFLIAFFSTHELWLLALIAVFMLCSFGKNIAISQNNLPKIIIPVDGIGSDKQLIKNICEAIKTKAVNLQEPTTVNLGSKKANVLDALPFKTMVEEKIPPETIENNQTLKKIIPHINLIAVGLIVILVLLGSLTSSANSIDRLLTQYDQLINEGIELVQNADEQDYGKTLAKLSLWQRKLEKLGEKINQHKSDMTEEQTEEFIRISFKLATIM